MAGAEEGAAESVRRVRILAAGEHERGLSGVRGEAGKSERGRCEEEGGCREADESACGPAVNLTRVAVWLAGR